MKQDKDIREVDAAVERVLAGLREVELPLGLEQRVLGAVRDRAAVGAGNGRRVWIWATTAATVMVVGLVPLLWRLRPAPMLVVRSADSAQGAVSQERKELPAVAAMPEESRGDFVKVRAVVRPKGAVARDGLEAISASEVDQRALEEARAPSQPAPPEPLTAEERRLMHIVMQGSEEQKDALNPVVRDARYEAAKAEVMRFFEPPKPKTEE